MSTYVQEAVIRPTQTRSKWLSLGGDFVTRLGDNTVALECTAFQLVDQLDLVAFRVSPDRTHVAGLFTPAGAREPVYMEFRAQR